MLVFIQIFGIRNGSYLNVLIYNMAFIDSFVLRDASFEILHLPKNKAIDERQFKTIRKAV